MRIAMFTDTYEPQVNGVVTMVRLLKEQLVAAGHDVFIFTVSHPKAKLEEGVFRYRSYQFPWEKQHRVASPMVFREAEEKVLELKVDLIHTHTMIVMGYIGNIIAGRRGIPSINTYHTLMEDYVHYIPFFNNFLKELVIDQTKRFCNKHNAVIVPSEKVKKLLKNYGVSTEIEVIPNGIELNHFGKRCSEQEKQSFRTRWGIPKDAAVMVFVGRLGKEKGVEFLIDNFAKIEKKYPNTYLMIVGDGPEKKNLISQAKTLKLQKKVIFTGYLKWPEEVSLAYQAGDFFVIASHTETFGVVLVEAMANGIPVVAYHDEAFDNIVVDGLNGYLVEQKEELYKGMDLLLSSRELRKKLGDTAREMAKKFSIENHVNRVLQLYQHVIGEK
ncbi:glycosyltransferase family 4 protein [Kosmotoga pacifica]|uniref:Glycosyl transferase family 1 n=1 Tax=Kosmotoga pacifica TaxID=1330330 RepID=A0A0G2Z8U9_9BACT|nr:glycosyltransferase family 4 protein [Kosmotoga pacifica]AKI98020.1 glycosyl transferase family 1 [Kosmotoga pacifica]